MNTRGKRNSSKRTGLCVRYNLDHEEHTENDFSDEDGQSVRSNTEPLLCEGSRELYQHGDQSTNSSQKPRRKPPHHLPRPNFWFHQSPAANPARRARAAAAQLGYRSSFGGDINDNKMEDSIGDGCVEKDPGFFVTTPVVQPQKDDVISWDSSCSESSSDEDIRDRFGRNKRGKARNFLWGSKRPPVPPSARNVTANKAEEGQVRASVTTNAGQGSSKKLENTFRMEPKAGQTFIWFKVKRPIINVVDSLLDEFVYNVKSGPAVTRKLCDVILKMVKKTFDWPRYKFVCNLYMAQLKNQGIMIADRALWSTSVDNVASYVHKTKDLVCVVTFHAIYCE